MALKIGDVAPDFEADTTEGHLRFHEWLGDSWGVLVSHPKDFTPVCTTELGYMAKMKPEFDKRNAKIIGISVDAVDTHKRWSNDIKETQGYAPNYPMIGDPTLSISKLYGMLPAEAGESCEGRTGRRQPDRPQRVRDRAGQEDQAAHRLPDDNRTEFRRSPARARFAAAHRQAQGGDAGELEAGRERDHRRLGVRRRGQEDLSEGVELSAALHSHRARSRASSPSSSTIRCWLKVCSLPTRTIGKELSI
jgi:peroxiredoxin